MLLDSLGVFLASLSFLDALFRSQFSCTSPPFLLPRLYAITLVRSGEAKYVSEAVGKTRIRAHSAVPAPFGLQVSPWMWREPVQSSMLSMLSISVCVIS